MGEKVTGLIVGTSCPFCSEDRLYRLREIIVLHVLDVLVTTARSGSRTILLLLHYVSLEIPANKAARGLGFGSTTVRGT